LDNTQATNKQVEDATGIVKERYLAVAFLRASDKVRFGKLLEDLENNYTKGGNNYPTTVTSAYNLVVNYKNYQKPATRLINNSEGVSFANVE
jgi:hypothetical protein